MTYSSQCQLLDLDPDQGTTVHLTTGAVNWAVEVCQDEIDTNHQWFCFLRAMAIRGLQQWLDQGAEALPLDYSRETAPQSGVNCQVKGFRLCLVVQGSLSDGVISIPRYTLKDPLNFAHLYILAEVQEEADQVKILAGLRRDRLVSFKESGNLALSRKGHYHVPLEDWDLSPEDLLLYLHCLNPETLETLNPETRASSPYLCPQPRLNVRDWLRDQLDTVAERFHWTLLPPLATAHQLMSVQTPAEELETLLRDLEQQGVVIPQTARGAYQELNHQGLPGRLYALTWKVLDSHYSPEWSLFLFLGPRPGAPLEPGTQLIVQDETSVLVRQSLNEDSGQAYLYTQVIGQMDEQFTVSIIAADGTPLTLPPFTFHT
ncbi:DUF1822 family protein [Phormidium yuhuli AB48]|uniref:DUF1822 family protein n=1 Tax=Phormidium yuhuli AB48 TaxID=2940671 RepID=A0ABY5AT22_9CYAN|nr:DUF1822 family protein [Phormidium yuhuli]USR92384.1 DUF1822 family protein [Phormidium yuhuli AB48]